ncbi:MAG: hypothetical protein AABZ84_02575 [Pseudomonadota bacterium]
MMMTWLIVLGEVVLVLLTVLGVMAWKVLRKRAREREAVSALVKSINDNQIARVEKLAGHLKDSAHLDDADALVKASELIKKQNRFYQDAIDLYFNRNNQVLSQLDHRLEDLIGQYPIFVDPSTPEVNQGLPEVDKTALEHLSKEIGHLTKNIEGLRGENADLQHQLKAAEQELDHLGREYVSAFNKSSKAEQEEIAAGTSAAGFMMNENLDELFNSPSAVADSSSGDVVAKKGRPNIAESAPDDIETQASRGNHERGLLADLDLSELITEDDQPKRGDDKAG